MSSSKATEEEVRKKFENVCGHIITFLLTFLSDESLMISYTVILVELFTAYIFISGVYIGFTVFCNNNLFIHTIYTCNI